jgi:hypothetical protein
MDGDSCPTDLEEDVPCAQGLDLLRWLKFTACRLLQTLPELSLGKLLIEGAPAPVETLLERRHEGFDSQGDVLLLGAVASAVPVEVHG